MLRVEVVYAMPEQQYVAVVDIEDGATIAEAITAARGAGGLPAVDTSLFRVGVFGKLADTGTPLCDGDRIEIYRPLQVEPMQARRRRAAKKLSRGKSGR